MLRDLAESGELVTAGTEAEQRNAAARLAVPDNVKDVIRQRVARLGHDTNRVLVMASVFGREFELDALQRLSELAENELIDALDAAVRRTSYVRACDFELVHAAHSSA